MRVRVTPSARAELLATVVRIRDRNRREAERFVIEVAARVRAVIDKPDSGPELASPWRSAQAAEGHRLYLRERTDGLWLIAVWPDPGTRGETGGHGETP